MRAPLKILFVSTILFFNKAGFAQLSQKPFLQRSNVVLGMTYSRMLKDPVFDEPLLRMQYGYSYSVLNQGKIGLDLGAVYSVKGGISFQEDVYQRFGYISLPLLIKYPSNGSFQVGLGLTPSFVLFDQTRQRGTNILSNPNPFPRNPSIVDASIGPFMEIGFTKRVRLNIIAAYSIGSSTDKSSHLHFGTLAAGFKINLGKSAEGIENLVIRAHDKDLKLLNVESGSVLVVLNKKESVAKYLKGKGDTSLAVEVLKDAELKNENIIRAFQTHFDFADVWFIYNTQLSGICSGDSSVAVFSTSGEVTSMEQISKHEYVLFFPGDIYMSLQAFSGDGYYFQDSKCQMLGDPFPVQLKIKTQSTNIGRMIESLNDRLKSRASLVRQKAYFKNR